MSCKKLAPDGVAADLYRISVFTVWRKTQIEARPSTNLSSPVLCFLNFQLTGLDERLSAPF